MADWPATQLERIGILSTDTREDLDSIRQAVYNLYGGAGNNPPTVIPYLIGDVGRSLMPFYFAAIMALAQIITIRVSIGSLVGHAIATMSLAAVFFTIQGNMFLHSANCLALLWVWIIVLLARVKKQLAYKGSQFLPPCPEIQI
jgi:hypothetical protein